MKRYLLLMVVMSWGFMLIQAQNQDFRNTTKKTPKNPYVTKVFTDENGNEIEEIIVPGRPPENYRAPVAKLPDPNNENANVLANVPAFSWSFGCSATSAAMIAGYYDRTGYENMYAGPTNSGVMPLNNSSWPNVVINGETRSQCPLSATRMGVDGRAVKGHVDDYWYMYGSEQDPYYGNWTQHEYGDCTADYMGTNQFYNFGVTDGATRFYSYNDGSPLYDYTGCEPGERDGCHGFKLFMESRGYEVQPNGNYSQRIYGYEGNTLGFTWEEYKAEIDAGRPVMIQIIGHTMVGFGYDESGESQLMYIHDTWDYNDHTMEWGGTYSGMQHYGVVVMMLEPLVTVFNPPTNLSVDNQGYATWEPPQAGTETIISHHNGYANNGIGTNSTASWVSAARFDTDDLASYYGSDLTSVNLHIRLDLFTFVELRIYKGGSFGNPGSMIHAEDITNDIIIDDWTTINLSAPVMLEAGNEYWIGYYIDATGGQPASNDFGPAVAGKGDWMNFGGSWVEISTEYGLDVNWCIEGVVTDNKNTGQSKTLSHQSRPTRDLLHYNIYLDGSYIGNTTDLYWQYESLSQGIDYTAGVSAVYSDGESTIVQFPFSLPSLPPPENFEVTDQGYATWDSPAEPIFEDDFESYTAGQFLTTQSPEWDTWSFNPGSNEDAYVSTEQALSGNNSVKIDGSSDVMHRFGDLTSGHYLLSANIYVPSGNGGYFNVMHHFGSPHEWACEAYFNSDGTGFMTAGGVNDIPFTYSTTAWTHVVLDIDLDGDWAIATINGTQVFAWQWSLDAFTGDQGVNQLDAIDFYSQAPYGQNPLYYFDDIVLLPADGSDALTRYNLYLNGTQVGNTTHTYYQFTDLNPGQLYTAGVTALYDDGESEMVTDQFTVPGTSDSYALNFDGEDDFVNCGHDASLNITEAITVEAWINPSGWGEDQVLGYGRIVDKNRIKVFLVNDGGTYYNNHSLVFIMHSGGSSYQMNTAENTIALDEWQHIATTYDGNGEAHIYINGVEQTLSGSPPSGSLTDHSTDDLYIGETVGQTRAFEGLIDEVRIWNVERSETEIQDNMFSYLEGTEPGLAGYWQMNEGLGSFVYDFSENNNTGQLGSTSGNDADDPEWTPTDWPYMILEADFSATPLSGNSPLTVQFTDESTGNPTSWEWDFENDGTVDSYDQNPEWTYNEIGDFTVSLSVSGPLGSDTETKNNYIQAGPLSIYEIQFTTVPGPDNTWPSTYEGQTLTTSGIVTAVGYNGQPNNFFISDPVSGPWKGIYVYNAGDTPAVGDEVVLTGTITEYFGMTEINAPAVSIVSSGNPVPDPPTIGSGTLSTTNQGEPYEGCLVTVEDVQVTQLPNANNEWYVSDGSGECQIDDRIFNYVPVTGETFSNITGAVDYSFDEYGINPRNSEDIEPYIELNAEFSANITSGNVPLTVQFTDESTGVPSSWEWDFDNDGTVDSYLQNPEYMYTEPGIYTVSLTVIDSKGSDTETKTDYITVISNLNANFTWDVSMGPAPLTVQFTDLSSGNPTSWEWDFENDDTIDSYEQNPEFTYETPGTYSIKLTVSDGYTTDSQLIGYIDVLVPLEAAFIADVTSGDAPLTVQFTDLSTGDPSSWEWDFENDGTVDSYLQNPEFTYYTPGVYTVSLTVSDSKGLDTEIKTDYITVLEEPATISEVTASQRTDGSKMVDINYDLSGPQTSYPILVEVSFNDGSTYEEVTEVSGDVGTVEPGTDLQITWDAGAEFPAGFYYETVKVRVTAIDEGWECGDLLTDPRDGQQYETVLIGEQCWMKENLAWLPSVSPSSAGSQSEPYYYVYGYQGTDLEEAKATANYQTYGTLYNWPAAVNVCEEIPGWHLPTDNEWKILEGFVDSQYPIGDPEWDKTNQARGFDVGKNLKSTSGWNNNGNGSDLYGFSALPSGRRRGDNRDDFMFLGTSYASWVSDFYSGRCLMRELFDDSDQSTAYFYYKDYGFPVRCLKTEAKSKASINGASGRNEFSGESPAFTMDTKNPEISLSSPNGGGIYSYLEMLDITWTATDDTFDAEPISAGISTEEGGAITWLASNIANSGTTQVDPPDLETLFALAHVKAVDTFGNEGYDASDDYFEMIESIIPLSAEFSGDITEGVAPLTVQFTDQSTGDPSSWEWDFDNDGTVDSYLQNPEFTYDTPGVYTVSLTVYDSKGFDTEIKTDYITVLEEPGTISEVTASQRTDGSKMVDINYDLSGPQTSYPILVEVSFNDGTTWEEITEVSGDIGTVEPGTGLQITWDAGIEFPAGFYYETVKVRVTAIDEGWECGDLLTDPRDGQKYETVLIGDQCWMAGDINVGTMINGTQSMSNNSTIEKYCYDNDPSICDQYGGLYQWNEAMQYATNEGTQGICPESWHIPTDGEWKILEGIVDSQYPVGDPEWNLNNWRGHDAGFNLKTTTGWNNNGNGSDLFSFHAVPGGFRHGSGYFDNLVNTCQWWTSSTGSHRWMRAMGYQQDEVLRLDYSSYEQGFSVRCIKNPDQPGKGHSSTGREYFSGESPAFTMDTKNPEVTLNTPNGGGIYSYQELLDITWTATDDTFEATPVSAGISTEEGGAITWLAGNIVNSGTTQVDPPDVETLFALAHVKAVDAFGNEGYDVSDDYFEMVETIIPLVAEFSADVTSGDAPLTVHFTDLSTGDPSYWEWDFTNDGTVDSNVQNPEYTYEEPGIYTVALKVYDSEGSDTETKIDYITVTEPLVADFTADVTSGDAPLTVQFTDLSTGYPSSWEWDFENDGTIDSYDQNPEHTYSLAGNYSVKLTIYDSKTSDTELKVDYISVYAGGDYFDPVWNSPYNPMTFYIMEANIDGVPLQEGDEVGLFDIDPSDGEEICVGAGILTEQLGGGVYLEMIASMNDGSNPDQANGFTPGHEIIYKLWSAENGEVDYVLANYPYPGYDEVYTAQGNTLVKLNGMIAVTQDINLETGWNLMSFRVEPEVWDMLQIVQPLIDEDVLYKVLDEEGGSIFHLPFPPPNGQWTNTIGDMQNTEGYYIKVNDNSMMTMTGTPVEIPMEIPLSTGWNIISYPCLGNQDALAAVQPLIDDGVLFKVIDEEGGSIFHLPFPPPNGQWTNTIGNFESGEGYYLKVTEECSITLSEPAKGSLLTPESEVVENYFFKTAWQNNPFMPMLIALQANEHLRPGDEIAVFDGDICVGAAVIENTGETVLITAAQDDPQTEVQDGFIHGHPLSFRIWNHNTGEVVTANPAFMQGDETFEPLGSFVGKIDEITNVTGERITGLNVDVMPNPFDDQVTIALNIPGDADVKVAIYNLMGQKVLMEDHQALIKGKDFIQLKNLDFEPGTYLLQITIDEDCDQSIRTYKLIKK